MIDGVEAVGAAPIPQSALAQDVSHRTLEIGEDQLDAPLVGFDLAQATLDKGHVANDRDASICRITTPGIDWASGKRSTFR